jgi:hypothetical protein
MNPGLIYSLIAILLAVAAIVIAVTAKRKNKG